jgi:cytochrome c2
MRLQAALIPHKVCCGRGVIMRLKQLIILILPFLLSTPALAEEEAVAPETIEVVETLQADVGRGKKIFESICIHCHNITNKISAVGCPGLKDVLTRHDEAWINQWLQGPEIFSKKDEKAKAVVAANPYGLIMPTIPEMQIEQDRKDIIEYLKTLK